MTTAVVGPPEQGQLVSVRSRQWIVNDVRPSTLPPPALKPAFSGPQHLLTLSSVEDDGLGEELQSSGRSSRGPGSSRRSPCRSRPGSTRPSSSTPSSTRWAASTATGGSSEKAEGIPTAFLANESKMFVPVWALLGGFSPLDPGAPTWWGSRR